VRANKFQNPLRLDIGTAKTTREFLSVDISPEADIQINLEGAQGRIPVDDDCVSVISCSHLIEHLTFDGQQCTLYDIYRMLTDDGFVSIVVPDTDTNSFWKGLRDHKDMRMNPYFFRSMSTQLENPLLKSPYFMHDYDGYAFGMQQTYMTGGFDFEILHLKVYPTQKYAIASSKLTSFASRSFTNVMDSYRIILKKTGAEGPSNTDYLNLILQLPQIEIDREVMYSRRKVRQFNDLSDKLINDFHILENSSLIDAIFNIELFDFAENIETEYRVLRAEVDEILTRLNGAAIAADLIDLSDAMSLADARYRIVAANLDGIRSKTPRPYRASDKPPPPQAQSVTEDADAVAGQETAEPEVGAPAPASRDSLWTRIVQTLTRRPR